MTSRMVTLLLGCGHTLEFESTAQPRIGEIELWCNRCRKTQVLRSIAEEWILRCRSCHYTRKFGGAGFNARSKANMHMVTKHHTVDVWEMSNVNSSLIRYSPRAGMHELALEDRDVPF